jgi:hypothetical protein
LEACDKNRFEKQSEKHHGYLYLQKAENESGVMRNFCPLCEGLRRWLLGRRLAALLWLQLDGENRAEDGTGTNCSHETLARVETEEEQLQCVRVVDGNSATADQAIGIFHVRVVHLQRNTKIVRIGI